jgi:ornithine carbamoyltransferase
MTTQLEAAPSRLATGDLLTIAQLTPGEVRAIFETAAAVKADPRAFSGALAGKTGVLLFEKESLRTKLSFEIGLTRLGATPFYHDHQKFRIGERESVPDYARNLERWTDIIIARVYGHEVIEELADACSIPVVNALSELYHPCQGLTDLFTLAEHLGTLEGARLAYIGDANNVCNSLMMAGAQLGMHLTVIAPAGYQPDPDVAMIARRIGAGTGATLEVSDSLDAVKGHAGVYTDAWVSMGHEAEAAQRHVALASYQVTPDVMALAGKEALFMHCLPAHRGFEVAPEVIDSPNSIVFDQAENRLHVQNAILLHLLADPTR